MWSRVGSEDVKVPSKEQTQKLFLLTSFFDNSACLTTVREERALSHFEISRCVMFHTRACGVSNSVRALLGAKWGGMSAPTIVPLAQRLAEENNVDWRSLSGSGPQGSVTEVDVLNYLARVMAGEEDLNPTAEPVPEGMEAWPEEDIRAHKAAQAGPQPTQSTPPKAPAAAPAPTPPATPPVSQAPQPQASAQAAPQASAQQNIQQDAKPYVKKEAYLELLQKHKTLTEQYTALGSKQSAGEAEAARFKKQAATLEGELTTVKAQVTSLKGELTALKERVASLTKERDKAAEALKRLPMLENENEALKTALAAEQAKVAQHRKASEELSAAQKSRPWWKFWG